MGFYASYKAVFDAVKAAVLTKKTVKTVILGEQFSVGSLPQAIINAEPSPVGQATMGSLLEVRVRGSVVLMVQDYNPRDWFEDVIRVMGDVADAILEDRKLGGHVFDCSVTGFGPGEIKFENKVYYGGIVRWEAILNYAP